MILPNSRVQWISDQKGYGLFATKNIPKGTITFVQDPLDIVVTPQMFSQYTDFMKSHVEKYSYESPEGEKIISWDNGKFMNHCCRSNSLTAGYGFELAVEDIEDGEEITDDYRIFSIHHHNMQLDCPKSPCNLMIDLNPTDDLIQFWDNRIQAALKVFFAVEQPLLQLIDNKTLVELKGCVSGASPYRSVRHQLAKRSLKK